MQRQPQGQRPETCLHVFFAAKKIKTGLQTRAMVRHDIDKTRISS
jgi:hypothetical protein